MSSRAAMGRQCLLYPAHPTAGAAFVPHLHTHTFLNGDMWIYLSWPRLSQRGHPLSSLVSPFVPRALLLACCISFAISYVNASRRASNSITLAACGNFVIAFRLGSAIYVTSGGCSSQRSCRIGDTCHLCYSNWPVISSLLHFVHDVAGCQVCLTCKAHLNLRSSLSLVRVK